MMPKYKVRVYYDTVVDADTEYDACDIAEEELHKEFGMFVPFLTYPVFNFQLEEIDNE